MYVKFERKINDKEISQKYKISQNFSKCSQHFAKFRIHPIPYPDLNSLLRYLLAYFLKYRKSPLRTVGTLRDSLTRFDEKKEACRWFYWIDNNS
jgi:hypothetical protein